MCTSSISKLGVCMMRMLTSTKSMWNSCAVVDVVESDADIVESDVDVKDALDKDADVDESMRSWHM